MSQLPPEDLYAKARHLHVDLAAEPFLIPLVKQAAVTPLPPQWTALRDEGVFRNELTGEVQATHPADAFFAKQIRELRRQTAAENEPQHPAEPSASGWVEFVDPQDARRTYYFDFVSGVRQEHPPKALLSDQLSGSFCGGVTSAAVASPQVFEHAATLHRQASMKNVASLEILCFTSWWTESALDGSRKRRVHVYFSVPTRHFQVVLDDADHVFTISHIVGPTGHVLSAWDLHVGARIPLLGRLTTLMQPTIKRDLETELLKYELQAHGRKPLTGRLLCADPHASKAGVSLRRLLTEIQGLRGRLAKHRPDIARRVVLPIDQDA
ncbi:hypothetical protein ATCC90586_002868 [Pythium insidiosum]|nr:hypothetical protein ATCC90586_002868 [Pythium insidiosum]